MNACVCPENIGEHNGMKNGLIILFAILSLSACGSEGLSTSTLSKLPAKILGGGKTITIRTETNQPAKLVAQFSKNGEKESDKVICVGQSIPAGKNFYLVSVAPNVRGYIELGVPNATPGATVKCSLDSGGNEFWSDSYTLEKPLGPNEAAFVNVDVGDFYKGEIFDD